MYAFESKRLHEIEIEIGQVADVIEPRRHLGFAKSRMFRHENFEIARQRLHIWQPLTGASSAVKEKQRLPGSAAHHAHLASGDAFDCAAWFAQLALPPSRILDDNKVLAACERHEQYLQRAFQSNKLLI